MLLVLDISGITGKSLYKLVHCFDLIQGISYLYIMNMEEQQGGYKELDPPWGAGMLKEKIKQILSRVREDTNLLLLARLEFKVSTEQ